MEKKRYLQLGDIASELGVSTSTVSRAISGKGNISRKTRDRVRAYIEQFGYQPNAAAQQLAGGRTGNIGVVLPSDAFTRLNDFFQTTLLGICQEAAANNYDVVITTVNNDDISYLKRLLSRRSVDGIILMRSLSDDPSMQYLCEQEADFVVIGSVDREGILQVDIPHKEACRELTLRMLEHSKHKVGIIIGDTNYIVNQNRLKGFLSAVKEMKLNKSEYKIYTDITEEQEQKAAMEELISVGTDTLLCGDDHICMIALDMIDSFYKDTKSVKVASFYNNALLKMRGITAINVDDASLGAAAVVKLISKIEDREVPSGITPGYRLDF